MKQVLHRYLTHPPHCRCLVSAEYSYWRVTSTNLHMTPFSWLNTPLLGNNLYVKFRRLKAMRWEQLASISSVQVFGNYSYTGSCLPGCLDFFVISCWWWRLFYFSKDTKMSSLINIFWSFAYRLEQEVRVVLHENLLSWIAVEIPPSHCRNKNGDKIAMRKYFFQLRRTTKQNIAAVFYVSLVLL